MVKNISKKIGVSIDISHWDMMKEFDQGMYEKMMVYREHMYENLEMDKKVIELLIMGMCSIIHDREAIRAHAERALYFGATKKELFEVAALSHLVGGVPSYRDTALTLKKLFQEEEDPTHKK
ncbi:MAG: carboxymuconolactone decarboxylase family protein [Candidatus Hodarchaeota archaeon]